LSRAFSQHFLNFFEVFIPKNPPLSLSVVPFFPVALNYLIIFTTNYFCFFSQDLPSLNILLEESRENVKSVLSSAKGWGVSYDFWLLDTIPNQEEHVVPFDNTEGEMVPIFFGGK
jgi:hypothetical protein